MSLYTDPNSEVIYRMLDLLPTISQALRHMQTQLEELRLEESAILFQDVATAIGSVTASLLPLLKEEENIRLLNTITPLRESISSLVDYYEQEDIQAVQIVMDTQLLPAYRKWQEEVEQRLRPFVLA